MCLRQPRSKQPVDEDSGDTSDNDEEVQHFEVESPQRPRTFRSGTDVKTRNFFETDEADRIPSSPWQLFSQYREYELKLEERFDRRFLVEQTKLEKATTQLSSTVEKLK
jgi:hypothetical protein